MYSAQQMLEDVLQDVPEDENPEEHDVHMPAFSDYCRPNVGKSR